MSTLSQSSISPSLPRSNRNQSIELCKFAASFLVVFAHVTFPGRLGKVEDCFTKFAVAFFFVVTGYFNYQVTDTKKLNKRIFHIAKLNLIATSAEIIWKLIETEYHHGSSIVYLRTLLPTATMIRQLLFLNINPLRAHLWYLFALLELYIILSMYVRFQGKGKVNYQPLYTVGTCLLFINIIFSVYGLSVDFVTTPLLSGNALFYGLPMLSFGIFLHEYQDRIMENFSVTTTKLLILLFAGSCLALIEMASSKGHFSYVFIGSIIQMVALMLLCLHCPRIAGQSKTANFIISKLGLYSTTIYIVHFIMLDIYNLLCQNYMTTQFGSFEGYLRPLIVAAMSLITAVLCDLVMCGIKRIRKH